ncbi:hypothetical protein ACGFZA_13310 [Streptomyces sp. NPDC048211]|uniref:hypothetical protein n=1 Tax=Streptomyces sp. NPDC048211 TaxID=3365516 RepID=UPI00371633E8
MHQPMMEALAAGELRPLREWLAGLQVETERLVVLPQWDVHPVPDHPPRGRRSVDRTEAAAAEILRQWEKAAIAPGGVPFLLLFVLTAVEAEWNISYDFEPLWETLAAAARCLRERGARLDASDQLSGRAVVALMESVAAQIQAENAMVTGQLDAQEAALNAAVVKAGEAGELARQAASGHPDLSHYLLVRIAEIDDVCGVAVARAVRGVQEFLATGEPLDQAIAQIEVAEAGAHVTDYGYLSELRAHRLALLSLAERKDAQWLRVEHGKIVYLYPFAVRGVAPEEVLDAVATQSAYWALGGTRPVSVNSSLNLDDVWNGSDAFKRRYGGALVELPDVLISSSDGCLLERVRAEIRFSRLGNHYVRFSREIADAGPAVLYAATLRAAPEYGSTRVAFSGGSAQWRRLSELSLDLAEDVCERLGDAEGRAGSRALASPGMFHVVVAVNAATTTRGPAGETRQEVHTAAGLQGVMGAQLLTNPVTHLIGSIAEWARYTPTSDLTTTMTGLTGEQIVRTSNTTAIIAPGMADFTHNSRGHIVEFVASLDGLFTGWSLELVDHYQRVEAFRARVDTAERDQRGSSQALRALAHELDAERVRLNDFATSVRSTITFIRSPSLVSSPVVADVLRRVLDGSTFHQRVAELNAMIEEVAKDQLGTSIAKLARQREEQETQEEERREGRQRAKLEVFLAVIAAAGVSGVVQVLQAGFFQSRDAAMWAAGSVSAIFIAALGLGYLFWPRGRR